MGPFWRLAWNALIHRTWWRYYLCRAGNSLQSEDLGVLLVWKTSTMILMDLTYQWKQFALSIFFVRVDVYFCIARITLEQTQRRTIDRAPGPTGSTGETGSPRQFHPIESKLWRVAPCMASRRRKSSELMSTPGPGAGRFPWTTWDVE